MNGFKNEYLKWSFETCWILKIEWFEMWEILLEIYSNEGFWNVIKNERFK